MLIIAMKKVRKFWMSPDKRFVYCQVFINGKYAFSFSRNMLSFNVNSHCTDSDVTTFDLELHAFLRVSHQLIVNPDSLAGEKIEEMFELENPNI